MSHHDETFAVDVPDSCEVALERLVEFYTHNGYTPVDAAESSQKSTAVMTRGKSAASWWSSDMSKLLTRICVYVDGDGAEIDYHVETTGQHLTDEDLQFWQREARAAKNYLHRRGELVDLRPDEARRAEAIQKEYRGFGLQAAILILFAIIAAGVLGAYLGLL